MKNRNITFTTILLALGVVAFSPTARAVSPPPDGGYPNFNTAEGTDALFSLTSGNNNTAIGSLALHGNTSGSANTATGSGALANNINGSNNTANGFEALLINTTGANNTANGVDALLSNTAGDANTANGAGALQSNTTGSANTANGVDALFSNTGGFLNTANGAGALQSNTTGGANTANGVSALKNNTFGGANTASGYNALDSNTTGFQNTANGASALLNNTIGNNNTANGYRALLRNTGSDNIALGALAGSNLTTSANNIDIGNAGVAGESNAIRIGKVGTQQATFIAAISGKAVPGGVSVIVDANGHLGTVVSSQRFKTAIKPMERASEAILALKPVTFRYKHELDPEGIPQFGLVAEQVEKVNADLVAHDEQGKPCTVRYEAVNAMLLNEFLKEHRKVQEQEATINQLQAADTKQEATIAKQQKQIEALATGLQKVSDQLELSKPVPRTVVNNQ
jgi:uncharacterized coiled-coil protein SlyX